MPSEITRIIDFSYTAPELPSPLIRRPTIISTLLTLYGPNIDAVCIDSPTGYGKTSLLLDFATSIQSPCFSTFLKSSSRLSYDPSLVRADLANQVHWFLYSSRLPESSEPTDGHLRNLWSRCARHLHRNRQIGYIIVDGLYHVPEDEKLTRLSILELLPIGIKQFRFLFSSNQGGMLGAEEKKLHVREYPISPFTVHETDEYLCDLVPEKDIRSKYHSDLGGVPTYLSSVRRIIEATGNFEIEDSTDLDKLLEAEWNHIKPTSKDTQKALAYLIALGRPVSIETIKLMSGILESPLESEFRSLPFLSFSTKTNGWEFTSDIFRCFVEDKLKYLVNTATEKLATQLLKNPDSDESLTHLPLYLEKTGNTDTLLEWLNEGRLASILHKTKTVIGVEPTLRNAISVSHSGKSDGALTTYALARSSTRQLAQPTGMEFEIRARSELGDVDGALAVANDVPLLTQRLRLLSICADSLSNTPGYDIQPLIDEIRGICEIIDVEKLSNEEAIDIATDLYPINPKLAIEILKKSITGNVEDLSFETALAQVSLSALRTKALSDGGDNDQSNHSTPKEVLIDKKLHRLLQASAVFFGEKSAKEVLETTSPIDDASARLYIQRKWIAHHPNREDTLDIVEIALRDAISETEFVPNATFYREISSSLPYVTDVDRRRDLISIIDGQLPNIVSKGPTVDVVRLQLIFAKCNYQENDLKRTATRLEELYLEIIDPIEEHETKMGCLGWFVAELHNLDTAGNLAEINELIEDEFKKTLREVLDHCANHYYILEEAIHALAIFKPLQAVDVAQQLNTLERRNLAFHRIIFSICRSKFSIDDFDFLLNTFDLMENGTEKDEAYEEISKFIATELEDGTISTQKIKLFISRTNNCLSSICKIDGIGNILVGLANKDKDNPYCVELKNLLISEFQGIDSERIKYRVACQQITKFKSPFPDLTEVLFSYVSKVQNRALVSENVEQGHFFILDLISKIASALAQADMLSKSDVDRISDIFSRFNDGYRKACLLSSFAFYLWRENHSEFFSDIVNNHLWPTLKSLNINDHISVYTAWREAYPVLWLDDRDRARNSIKHFPSESQDDCISSIIYSILNRQPYGEPFDYSGSTKVFLKYSDMENLLHLCNETNEDALIFFVYQRIADELTRKKSGVNLSREQKVEIARRMVSVADNRLPIESGIRHDGYKILCKAQALRINELDSLNWANLIQSGKNLSNSADRIFVLTHLAASLPTNKIRQRNKILCLAEEETEKLKSTEDKFDRYMSIADLIYEKDRVLAARTLKKANETVSHTKGRRSTIFEHRLVNLAYRFDPDLPMKLAALHDDDPARDGYRERVIEQINRQQLKADIGDTRSKLDISTLRDNPNLASAAWQAVGGLNSGRLIATDIVRLREMLVCASNYPLNTSYPMYSWVITNVTMKYAKGGSAKKGGDTKRYIREIFEGFLRGAEFYVLASGGENGLGSHPEWDDKGGTENHVLILPGQRDKGIKYIQNWIQERAEEYIVIVDPYFGTEELEYIIQIMDIDPSLQVKILTSKQHNRKYDEGLPDAYSAAWRNMCDQTPPETEITVVGVENSGKAPFHDRWIYSKTAGLSIGTSLNSLGVRDTQISMLGSDGVGRIKIAMEQYLNKTVKVDGNGERVRYESFELW